MKFMKRPLAVLLSVLILLSVVSSLPLVAQAANPEGKYIYNLSVQTTDDSDDWNTATLKLYNSNDRSIPEKSWTITTSIDDPGEEFKVSYQSEYFYNKVDVNFSFGGNIAIHHWAGKFTADLNGKVSHVKTYSGTSAPFSSCNLGDTFEWAEPQIQSVDVYTKDESGNKTADLKITQSADSETAATGYIYLQMIDQYNVQMKRLKDTINLITADGESAEIVEELPTECKIKLQSTHGYDYTCPITIKKGDREFNYDVDFAFLHHIDMVSAEHGTVSVSAQKAYTGNTVTITSSAAEGYALERYTVTDENGNDVPVSKNTFIMPNSNVSVSADFAPISYMAKFVANGKIVAEVPYTVETAGITEPEVPTKDGYTGSWKSYVLSIGGITVEAVYEPIVHDFRVSSSTPATCTTEGYDTYTCIYCGETYNKVTTPAKAHQFVATGFTSPSCTQEGYQTYKCLNCDETYTGNYISAKGHTFSADVVAPTCTQEGYTTYTCEVCGEHRMAADGSVYKTNITRPVSHNYIVSAAVPATCTTEGYETYTCTVCGNTYHKTTTPALTHEWRFDKWTNDETDHWHACTRCEAALDKQAHLYGEVSYEWEGTEAVTASHTCTVCAYVESERVDTTSEMTKEPACTVKGKTTYTATFTNAAFEVQTKTLADIPALGHDWKLAWSKNGTHHWHNCNRCNAVNKKAVHAYGTKGTSRYTCKVCGYLDKARKAAAEKADKQLAYARFVAGLKGTSDANKVTLKWGKAQGADRYVIYAVNCGLYNKYRKIATLNSSTLSYNIKKLNGKKINSKNDVRAYVIAQKKVNGKYVNLFVSPRIHTAGANSVNTNAKKVNVEKKAFTLGVKKTAVIKPSLVLVNQNKQMIHHVAKYRFLSSNTAVVSVDKTGKIKAVGKGVAYVYVYANNGFANAVKITVK